MNLVAWFRLALVVVVAWPFLIAAAAMVGVPTLTAAVAVLPLVAAVSYLVVKVDPILGAQLASDARVLRSWQTIRTVVLVELAIGAYLTFVPVQAKPFLLVQLALVLTILVLSQAGGFLVRLVPWVAGAIFLWLTASFFWHSLSPSDQEQLKARMQSLVSGPDRPPAAPAPRPQEPQTAVSRPTVTPAPADRRDLFQEARRTLPGVIKEIYAALNDGNPRAAAVHLGGKVFGDARTLDLICRPFSYRAHYVEEIAERPGHGIEVWVRALFRPMEEHAYQFTFAHLGGRFVLVRAADNVLSEPNADAAPAALARKFVYAGIAGEREVMAHLTTLDLSRFFDSHVMRALSQGSIHNTEVRMRSDRGLKAQVLLDTVRKDGAFCDPGVTVLIEPVAAVPKVVAMRWSAGCWGREPWEQEDPQLEAYTLRRFGLAAPAAAVALASAQTSPPAPSGAGVPAVSLPPAAPSPSRTIATYRFPLLAEKDGAWQWRTQTLEVTDTGVLVDDGRSGPGRSRVRLGYASIVSCTADKKQQSLTLRTRPGPDTSRSFYWLHTTVETGKHEAELARLTAACDQLRSAREAWLTAHQK